MRAGEPTKVVMVRKSRSAACGVATFSRHLASTLRAQGTIVDDRNTLSANLSSSNTIVHYVPSMWTGAASDLEAILNLADGRVMVILHGLYPVGDLNHGGETPCPDLPDHMGSIGSRAACIIGLSKSCSRLYVEWADHLGLKRSVTTLLHPGLYLPPRRRSSRNYVFYGGIVRSKKRITGKSMRSLFCDIRRSGFDLWVHASNLPSGYPLRGPNRVTTGLRSDKLWGRMIADAYAVVCPYETRVQCVSGIIAEAISIGTPVVSSDFLFAREMRDQYPGSVVVSDDLVDWPRLLRSSRIARPSTSANYPDWVGFGEGIMHELGT
jgi:hypothetical protein